MVAEWQKQLKTIVEATVFNDLGDNPRAVAQVLNLISEQSDPNTQQLIRDTFIALGYGANANPESYRAWGNCVTSNHTNLAQCQTELHDLLQGQDPGQQYDFRGENRYEHRAPFSLVEKTWSADHSLELYRYKMQKYDGLINVGLDPTMIAPDLEATYSRPANSHIAPVLYQATLQRGGSKNWQGIYFKGDTSVTVAPNGQIVQGTLGANYTDPLTGAEYKENGPIELYPNGLIKSGVLAQDFGDYKSGETIHWDTQEKLINKQGQAIEVPDAPLPEQQIDGLYNRQGASSPTPSDPIQPPNYWVSSMKMISPYGNASISFKPNNATTLELEYTLTSLSEEITIGAEGFWTPPSPNGGDLSLNSLFPENYKPVDGRYRLDVMIKWGIADIASDGARISRVFYEPQSLEFEVKDGYVVPQSNNTVTPLRTWTWP